VASTTGLSWFEEVAVGNANHHLIMVINGQWSMALFGAV
jgi:hypothetical protein